MDQQRQNMRGFHLFRQWESVDRLFGARTLWNPTEAQQQLLIQQIDYWRSLGPDRFKELTCLDMTLHREPVYKLGQLPLDMLFMTYTKLTKRAIQMDLRLVLEYWVNRLRSHNYEPIRIRIALKQHADNQSYYWHILVKFDKHYLFKINHLRQERAYGPNSSIEPVYDWQSAIKYLGKDSAFIDWEQGMLLVPLDNPEQEEQQGMLPIVQVPVVQEVILIEDEPSLIIEPPLPSNPRQVLELFAHSNLQQFVRIMRRLSRSLGFDDQEDCFSLLQ